MEDAGVLAMQLVFDDTGEDEVSFVRSACPSLRNIKRINACMEHRVDNRVRRRLRQEPFRLIIGDLEYKASLRRCVPGNVLRGDGREQEEKQDDA